MTAAGNGHSALASVLLGLTGGLGLLTVAATLGALLGFLWWPLDLLTSFHPVYAVLLLGVAAVHLMLRSRVTAVWLLAAAVVNASIAAPHLFAGGLDREAPDPHLTVMSFNVGVSNPMRQEVAEYVAGEGPDLLFVLESSFEWEAALKRWGPPMASLAVVPGGWVAGISVLADPALGARAIPFGFSAAPGEAAAVEVTLDGRRVVVLGLHPPSPTSGDRAGRRDRILRDAGDWVASLDVPVLVVGDLNATPWSSAFRELRYRGRLLDTSRAAGLQTTWPEGWGPLMIPIDHALHTRGLVAVDRRIGPALGSLHRPVVVTVAPDRAHGES